MRLKHPPKPYELPSPEVSRRMKKVRRHGTDIEQAMKSILTSNGFSFRSQPRITGRPDFRLLKTKIVIFCDSTFWHGRYPELQVFKVNAEFWKAKIAHNRSNDKAVNKRLRVAGWTVLRFWDTDIRRHPLKIAKRLQRAIGMESLNPADNS